MSAAVRASAVPIELVVVGATEADRSSLEVLCWGLPGDFSLPVIVACNGDGDYAASLEVALRSLCPLPVSIAQDKQPIAPRHVYLCPADYHLFVERGWLSLGVTPPVNHARPSVELLFWSASRAYGARLAGVVLSGSGQDGDRARQALGDAGAMSLCQPPHTASEIAARLGELCSPSNERSR